MKPLRFLLLCLALALALAAPSHAGGFAIKDPVFQGTSPTFNAGSDAPFRSALGLVPSSAGAIIYVSKESAATDTRTSLSAYDPAKPFATIKAALAAASAGDSIVVKPGSYSEGSGTSTGLILKSVTIYARGATVTYAGSGNPGLLNDAGGGVTCRILGGSWTGTNTTGLYPGASSTIFMEAENLAGPNGGYFSDTGTNNVTLKVPNMTGGIQVNSAGTFVFQGNNTGGVGVGSASAKAYVYGNVTAGIAVGVSAGYLEGWGDVTGNTSDALHASGGTIVWHGKITSPGDCGVYCSGAAASVTVYGPVSSTGASINLCGRGNGIAASMGTVRVFGDVTGPIGVVCGEADVEIWGQVSSNSNTGPYTEQSPQLDTNFNQTCYRPSTTSAQNDYLGAGAVKTSPTTTGRLVIHGKCTSAYGHGIIVNAGEAKAEGPLISTDGHAVKLTGGTFISENRVKTRSITSISTATFTSSGTTVTTGAAHGRVVGNQVVFTNSGGALPAAVTANTIYYVVSVGSSTTMTISATAGGSAITFATAGSGTHTILPAGNPIFISGGTAILADSILMPLTGRKSIYGTATVYAHASGQTLDSDSTITFSPAGGMVTDAAYDNF